MSHQRRFGRIQAVESMRVLAMLFVIVIHTHPLSGQVVDVGGVLDVGDLLNQAARFAVPYFFLMSGYFWSSKVKGPLGVTVPAVQTFKRVAFIFLAWSLIYMLPTNLADAFHHGPLGPLKYIHWHLLTAAENPGLWLLTGSRDHLWFLGSLLTCVLISAVLLRLEFERSLLVLAVLLYLLGLAGKAYAQTPWGFHSDFNFRNGPFFGLLFFVSGHVLRHRTPNASWLYQGGVLAVLGMVMHFAEVITLHRVYGAPMTQDYVVGTYLWGLGLGMVALSNPRPLRWGRVSGWGVMMLGVYVVHVVFIDLLYPVHKALMGHVAWELSYPLLVFSLSIGVTRVMLRHPRLARLIS